MIIISLGYTCYVKSLIKLTKYNKESDIFDWMNSFEFNKIIKAIDNKFDIFSNITKSQLNVDIVSSNVYFNKDYSFRLPHETNINDSIITYNKRYERFVSYKNDSNNYLFIRLINGGRYGINAEIIENNYNENCYNQIMTYLPVNSKILLISDKKMTNDDLNKVYNKFIVVDNCMNPEHVFFGKYLQHKELIINSYKSCFEYIDTNFNNLDEQIIYNLLKNEHIGI
jgi:hypothetical protein